MSRVTVSFIGSGVLVRVFEVNSVTQQMLEENYREGFPKSSLEIIEKNSINDEVLLSGLSPEAGKKLVKKIRIDNHETDFQICEFTEDYEDLFEKIGKDNDSYDKRVLILAEAEAKQSGESCDLANSIIFWSCRYLDELVNPYFKAPDFMKEIADGNELIFQIIHYERGTLTASFETNDLIDINDIRLCVTNTDFGKDEHQLCNAYYSALHWDLMKEYGESTCFDEVCISAIEHEGQRFSFDLDFEGGSGWYTYLERDGDDWERSLWKNQWLEE